MSATPDILNAPLCTAAQLWLAEYLRTRESLVRGEARVPIVARREKNIADDIEAAMSTLGACLYVLPLLPVRFNVNLPGPFVERAELRVRCFENDTMNETLPNVHELVEAVVRDVHALRFPATLQLTELLLAPERPVEPQPDAELLIYDVVFHCEGQYRPRVELQ